MDNSIDIVLKVRPDSGAEQAVVKTLSSIQKTAESQGRRIGDSFSKSVTGGRENLFANMMKGSDKATRQMVNEYNNALKEMKRQTDIFSRAGLQSPQQISQQIANLKEAKQAWMEAGKGAEGYAGAMGKINSQLNVLESGNARARGSLHKFTAALASATFEITGAIYGITALGAILSGPAIFGGSFLKSIEDTKHGIAATITAMAQAAGGTLNYAQASAIASKEIDQLNANALKYNISLEDVAKTYQAIIGPGMAAGMTLKEVGQIATIGTIAVKSLGMNSMQVVQEVRDLVQGGIQAASSTLATALGLKDADISAAKKSAEGLFTFLEKRLAGYTLAAMERQNTLSGIWDLLKIKVQRLFSDETGFSAFKGFLKEISDTIGKINAEGGIDFNKDIIKIVQDYWTALKAIGSVLTTVIELSIKFADTIFKIGSALGAWKLGTLVIPVLVSGFMSLKSVLTSLPALFATSEAAMMTMGVTMNSLSAATTKMSMASKGGLIGLALFAAYEAADYLGIIDSVMSTAESRLKEFQNKIAKMGTATLEAQYNSLEAQIQAAKKRESEAGMFGLGFAAKERQDLERQQKEIGDQLQKRLDLEKVANEAANQMRSAAGRKALATQSSQLKDSYGIQEKYQQRVLQLVAEYGSATLISDEETRKTSQDQYNRLIEAAQKERDDALKALNKEDRKAISDKRRIDDSNKLMAIKTAELQLKKELAVIDEREITRQISAEQAIISRNNAEITALETKRSALQELFKQAEVSKDQVRITKAANDLKVNEEALDSKLAENKKELTKQRMAEYDTINSSKNAIQDLLSDYQLEQESLGKTTLEIEKLKNARAREIELRDRLTTVGANGQRIDKPLSATNRAQIEEEIKMREEISNARAEEQQSFEYGWKKAFGNYTDNAVNAAKQAQDAFQTMTKGMEDAMYEFATTGKLSFSSFLKTVLEGLLKIQIQKTIAFAASSAGGSGLLGLVGLGISAMIGTGDYAAPGTSDVGPTMGSIFANARGGTYSNSPSLSAYSGSIVSQPTLFAFANGGIPTSMGLMGEAGPEAIMPLTRGPNGKLGVQANGSGGDVIISVEVNIASDGTADTNVNAPEQGKQFGQMISNAVVAEIIKQKRSGGLLNERK